MRVPWLPPACRQDPVPRRTLGGSELESGREGGRTLPRIDPSAGIDGGSTGGRRMGPSTRHEVSRVASSCPMALVLVLARQPLRIERGDRSALIGLLARTGIRGLSLVLRGLSLVLAL